jgi:hypothetical protein
VAYTSYLIFNKTEFEALGLTSKTYTYNLDGIGERDILVTSGVALGITYEGVFLPLQLNGENPFYFEDHAIFIEEETQNVYLGILDET